jgi:hypothetical protein
MPACCEPCRASIALSTYSAMSTVSCTNCVRQSFYLQSLDPHEHRVPLYDLQYQLVILGVSIFAFEHKVHIRCSDVDPRDGIVRLDANSMRILRYSDTHVGRHFFDVGGIRQPLEVCDVLFWTQEGRMLNPTEELNRHCWRVDDVDDALDSRV